MSNFMDATLTRAEMKNVIGSDAGLFCKSGGCTIYVQGSNGKFVTRNGTCATMWQPILEYYCNTGGDFK